MKFEFRTQSYSTIMAAIYKVMWLILQSSHQKHRANPRAVMCITPHIGPTALGPIHLRTWKQLGPVVISGMTGIRTHSLKTPELESAHGLLHYIARSWNYHKLTTSRSKTTGSPNQTLPYIILILYSGMFFPLWEKVLDNFILRKIHAFQAIQKQIFLLSSGVSEKNRQLNTQQGGYVRITSLIIIIIIIISLTTRHFY